MDAGAIFLTSWFVVGLIGVLISWFADSSTNTPVSEWIPVFALIYGPVVFVGALVVAYQAWSGKRRQRYRIRRLITRHDQRWKKRRA